VTQPHASIVTFDGVTRRCPRRCGCPTSSTHGALLGLAFAAQAAQGTTNEVRGWR
jgi:hypothetical protein